MFSVYRIISNVISCSMTPMAVFKLHAQSCLNLVCPGLPSSWSRKIRLFEHAGPPLGLFWASPGALLGPILGLRRAILGLLAAPGASEPSWASSRLLLGSSLAGPGGPWAHLGVTLGGSWASLGPSLGCSRPLWGRPGGFLGLLWGVLGGSWPPKAIFTKPCKNRCFCVVFAWFRAFWAPLGGSWVALGPS